MARRNGAYTTALLVAMLVSYGPLMAADNKAFSDILKGIEPGKRFHSIWPPVLGRTILGVVVVAKDPDKWMGSFESIESPRFRDPAYPGPLESGTLSYLPPEITRKKPIDVDVAAAELEHLRQEPGAPGSTATSSPPPSPAGPSPSPSPKAASPSPSGTPPPAASASPPASAAPRQTTGIDWSRFTHVERAASAAVVEYYTLTTLEDLGPSGRALSPRGRGVLTPDQQGWIIHRALRLDGLQYELTTNTIVDVGFFAKLVSWLPSVSVHYVNERTVKLVATQPVYIGYKLWRPGTAPAGAAIENVDIHTLGLGEEEIEREFARARH